MPMSVEEYRIAQLYMIQVRSAPSEEAGNVAQRRVTRVAAGGGQRRGSRRRRRPPVQRSRGRALSRRPDGAPCARGLDPV